MLKHRNLGGRLAAASLTGAAFAWTTTPVLAQQVVLQGEAARLSVEPYGAATTLGGRAELSAELGKLDTTLSAALERGGGRLAQSDHPAGAVQIPTAWRSAQVRSATNWAVGDDTTVTLELEDRDRWSRNFASLVTSGDGDLARDSSSVLRLQAQTRTSALAVRLGAELTTGALHTRPLDAAATPDERWLNAHRFSAQLTWRASERLSVEAGQAFQAFDVGWRGASEISSASGELTPSIAVALTPERRTRWRFEAERTLSPMRPDQFAAYAQLATPGAGSAPEPDQGWRYGATLDQDLGHGVRLKASANDWRLASVTELGPVGAGEAPVSIGAGSRQQVDLGVAAPLPAGVGGAALAAEVSLRRSEVRDPFTGQARSISGEAPYRAQIRLSGALPSGDLNWSLVARADGPQRLNQMTQVTALGATRGLGGSVTYGAGPIAVSLELDNLVGGSRRVTTYGYSGSRADQILNEIIRRNEDSRAVRIALKRRL